MEADRIPDGLKRRHQWIGWQVEERDGKRTKVPVDPGTGRYASVADPTTWTSYESALDAYREGAELDGLGYVFTADGPYFGIDMDDCRDPATGMVEEWAVEILLILGSYAEISPKKGGLHGWGEGELPDGGNRRGQIEIYDRDRYFTVTGDHVRGTPETIQERQQALNAIHGKYIADDDEDDENGSQRPQTQITLDDEELLEKALNAANGDKFRQLWIGDVSGYPSHSEADQALCNFLAFWCGGDERQMERLFNQSGLVREKWRNRADYRERTIREAVKGTTEFYEPNKSK